MIFRVEVYDPSDAGWERNYTVEAATEQQARQKALGEAYKELREARMKPIQLTVGGVQTV